MKKISFLTFVLLATVFLSGCGQNTNNPTSSDEKNNEEVEQQNDQKKLAKMIENGEGVKCSVEDEMGKYELWAQNGKMKIDGIEYAGMKEGEGNKKGTMINDGIYVYIWSGKEGTKMIIKNENKNSNQSEKVEEVSVDNENDWSDWVEEKDKVGAKYECQASNLSDADFTPPADVNFQDFSDVLKNFESQSSGDYQNMNFGN